MQLEFFSTLLVVQERITVLTGSAVENSIDATVKMADGNHQDSDGAGQKSVVEPVPPPIAPTPRLCTDLGNAERFVDQHGDRVRYCHPFGKWFVYDGTRWLLDNIGLVLKLAQATARSIWDEARQAEEPNRRDELGKHAAKSEKAERISAMLKLAQARVPVLPVDLDRHPWLLNCINGTVDLKTGAIREHRREDMLTTLCPTPYEPAQACPTFEKALSEIMRDRPQLVEFIRRALGMSLCGEIRDHVLLFCYGVGANGKSLLLNCIEEVLGPDFAMKAPPDLLMAKHGDSHPTERADLFGKRFVIAIECEDGKRLAEGLVKELTGGDSIRARRMREDFWQFKPTHHVWLAANHKPVVRGTDNGIWRRLRLLPFERVFADSEQDKSLPRKLMAEAPGILAWMVQGCMDWQRDGLADPQEIQAATADYRNEMDVIGAFIEEKCLELPTAKAQATKLYSTYRAWCDDCGEHSLNQRRFGQAMSERGFERFANNGRWYRGIGLRFTEPSE